MLVCQVMHGDIVCVRPDESTEEAARKMKAHKAGAAIVVEDGEPRGFLTEKDMNFAPDSSDARTAFESEVEIRKPGPTDVDADKDRCCYFNEVMVELLNKG